MQMQNYTKIKDLQEKMKEIANPKAVDVSYDGSASHVDVDNLQEAVDRLYSGIGDIGTSLDRLNTSTDRIDTLLGDTDISAIGDGTVTGAISEINTDLSDNSTLSSGYYVAPNGLKFIWGATDNVSVSANSQGTLIQEITFPVQMSNANYRVAMSNNMGVPVIPFTYNRTTSGFKIYGGNPFASNMNATIEYIVIGY